MQLKGTAAALVTPFKEDFSIDYEALKELLDFTGKYLDYLVINGTTAEAPTLSAQEKTEILKFALANNPHKKPIVFGIGGNNTQGIIATIQNTDLSGVSALLSGSPHYNKPTQAGIIRHYELIADASPIPIILYNVPGRTASNMEANTTIELSKHPNIIGIKEASNDLIQCMEILEKASAGFSLISGDDFYTPALIAHGAQGVISVIANAFPDLYSEVVKLSLGGKIQEATTLYLRLFQINKLLFREGNPTGIKEVLRQKGIGNGRVRLPLVEATDRLKEQIGAEIRKISTSAVLKELHYRGQ